MSESRLKWPSGMEIPTRDESYRDGYDTGFDWKDNYIPGGPLVYKESSFKELPDHIKRCISQTVRNHATWMVGFYEGLIDAKKEAEFKISVINQILEKKSLTELDLFDNISP